MSDNREDFYIRFDTRINPGKVEATRVRIDNVTITNINEKLAIALCGHPLYRDLVEYVKSNPIK